MHSVDPKSQNVFDNNSTLTLRRSSASSVHSDLSDTPIMGNDNVNNTLDNVKNRENPVRRSNNATLLAKWQRVPVILLILSVIFISFLVVSSTMFIWKQPRPEEALSMRTGLSELLEKNSSNKSGLLSSSSIQIPAGSQDASSRGQRSSSTVQTPTKSLMSSTPSHAEVSNKAGTTANSGGSEPENVVLSREYYHNLISRASAVNGDDEININANENTSTNNSANSTPAPVDCVGSWGQWGACSKFSGQKQRKFTISQPAKHNGKNCISNDRVLKNGDLEYSNSGCNFSCQGAWRPDSSQHALEDGLCKVGETFEQTFMVWQKRHGTGTPCKDGDRVLGEGETDDKRVSPFTCAAVEVEASRVCGGEGCFR